MFFMGWKTDTTGHAHLAQLEVKPRHAPCLFVAHRSGTEFQRTVRTDAAQFHVHNEEN